MTKYNYMCSWNAKLVAASVFLEMFQDASSSIAGCIYMAFSGSHYIME